jgi:DNA-binding transcriptional ArsR family regulator
MLDRPPATLADADVAPIAALLSDRARVAMLWALSDGRMLPAGELARIGRVGAPAASAHLAKLAGAQLISAERHGRHRYYRLIEPNIIHILEGLATIAPSRRASNAREAHAASAIRLARTCYDHVAGAVGVAITDRLVRDGCLVLEHRTYRVTELGVERLNELGVDVGAIIAKARTTRRPLARACLDWSERRYHLAGALGAKLCERLLELNWLAQRPSTRALLITNLGRRELRRRFGIEQY